MLVYLLTCVSNAYLRSDSSSYSWPPFCYIQLISLEDNWLGYHVRPGCREETFFMYWSQREHGYSLERRFHVGVPLPAETFYLVTISSPKGLRIQFHSDLIFLKPNWWKEKKLPPKNAISLTMDMLANANLQSNPLTTTSDGYRIIGSIIFRAWNVQPASWAN